MHIIHCYHCLVQVIDMPLLFETGFYKLTRPRVLVACGPAVQLQRLMSRDGSSKEAAQARINSQMPLEAKVKLADVVIHNDGDMQELQQQVSQNSACAAPRVAC